MSMSQGTLFFIMTQHLHLGTDKLTLHWKPHYRIIERLSAVNYRICHLLTGKAEIVHAVNLQPAFPEYVWDAERNASQEPSPDIEESGKCFLKLKKTPLTFPDDNSGVVFVLLPCGTV